MGTLARPVLQDRTMEKWQDGQECPSYKSNFVVHT